MKKLLLPLLLLTACSNGLEDKIAEKGVAFLSCPYYHGIKNSGEEREMCKDLSKFLFETAVSDCSDDFYHKDLSDETISRFTNMCILNWLERQEIELAKEVSVYQLKKNIPNE